MNAAIQTMHPNKIKKLTFLLILINENFYELN